MFTTLGWLNNFSLEGKIGVFINTDRVLEESGQKYIFHLLSIKIHQMNFIIFNR